MAAYYNEIDPYAAQWLRNLIEAGHIAPGIVDERSIEDVHPSDLHGFTQCHFFAGIGVWSLALRRAGWADDRPVWTGSCPCQPFSAAGAGAGFADARHLWPTFAWLIKQCGPAIVFGEQVASKAVEPWVDLVHADVEALGYAFGAIPFPSAGVGAPHIRDRLFWVADSKGHGHERTGKLGKSTGRNGTPHLRAVSGMAGANGGNAGAERQQRSGQQRQQPEDGGGCEFGGMADNKLQQRSSSEAGPYVPGRRLEEPAAPPGLCSDIPAGPVNGFWRNADWLGFRDDKWRPVSPKPQPLVDGAAESLGRVCAGSIEKIEGEINAWAVESEIDSREAMRDLHHYLAAKSHACWAPGRLPGLHEAPFLLAFMRQLAGQGWGFSECSPLQGSEASEAGVRVLRDNRTAAGAPRQHGLEGQQPGECSNAVHFLSSLLARHAHTAWNHAYSTYAEIGFPLAHGARSRTGRLRAYGNAINAEAATQFIAAYLET